MIDLTRDPEKPSFSSRSATGRNPAAVSTPEPPREHTPGPSLQPRKSGKRVTEKTAFQTNVTYSWCAASETKSRTGFIRYYNPIDGRWINRDPMAESGGENLYGMLSNGSINWFDLLGLKCITSIYVEFSSANNGDQPDLQNHKKGYNYKTGRVYDGSMSVSYDDGTQQSWSVHDGGYKTDSSHVNQGDDSVTPGGDGTVSTTQGGSLDGFVISISGASNRSALMIHNSTGYGTHGCVGVTGNFNSFADDMKTTKTCCKKQNVDMSVRYYVSDGEQPKGDLGDGKTSPQRPPPKNWPGPDPGPTNSENPY